MDEIDEVVRAVSIPVQAVGGLSIEQAIECPSRGAPLVVLGAPLVIDARRRSSRPPARHLHDVAERNLPRRSGSTPAPTRRCAESPSDTMPPSFTTRSSRWRVELREVAIPDIGDDDVLLRGRRRVGLRLRRPPGAQHAFLAGERAGRARPRVRRHGRAAGRAVRGFSEGDRVVCETAAEICGECLLCRTGRYNLCPSRKGFGYGVNGAMAEYVQGAGALPAPRSPTRCRSSSPAWPSRTPSPTTRCASTRRFGPGDVVVVLGPGPIGLLCARMAALAGADPLIVVGLSADARAARDRARGSARRTPSTSQTRERSTRSCAASTPLGADLVCDASGASRPLDAGARGWRVRTARSPRSAGRRTSCPWTSTRWCRRTSGCRDRSATTIRSGSA